MEGSCSCDAGYIGDDCSVESSIPPENVSVPLSGLCQIGDWACRRTNILGISYQKTCGTEFDSTRYIQHKKIAST